jgi:protein-S-isoprenylcysteine O-methyltransferase Ste14
VGPTSIRATAEERRRTLPGDGLLDEALGTWTHGVTIAAPPRAVWPWLAQMGAGRAGWYSWDFLDNGGHPSASEVVAGWQRIAVGDVLPMAPGATDAFVVQRLEPGRDLVLAMPHPGGGPSTTWEFLLEPLPGDRTRLLVRARVGARGGMTPRGAASRREERVYRALARFPRRPILALARAVHRVMQARQLRGIRRRAEARRPAPQGNDEGAGAAGTRTARLPRLFRADNGMNIVGQGGRIMLVTMPALAAAMIAHLNVPDLVRIPLPRSVLAPPGVALAVPGLALWLTAVVQLLVGFPRGKLVTSGAYGVCRNPIYSSMALFVLPGVSLMTGTWAYLVPAAVLLVAVLVFIREEERDLLRVFGDEYRRYTARVHRVIPFVRSARSSA